MTTTPIRTADTSAETSWDVDVLDAKAREHLWMHFTRLSSYANAPVPTIVRGEGARIFDIHGKSYLDGLAGLFVVQAGHGRKELAEAAYKQAGELGFCGLYVDEAAGGSGLTRLDAAIVFEELAAVDPSTAAFISIHNMATWMLAAHAQPALREAWAAALAGGAKLASYCLTEPGAGSDAASLKTRAVRDGDHYLLDGSKAFISGAGETDMLVVMARTGGEGARGISAFAVPADTPGIAYGRKEEKLGWHSQPTRGIAFEGVADALRVPGSDIRLFGKPESFQRRRMGVAPATADDVDTARARALEAAGKVRPVSGKR